MNKERKKYFEDCLHQTLQSIAGKLPDDSAGDYLVVENGSPQIQKRLNTRAEATAYCEGLRDGLRGSRTEDGSPYEFFVVIASPESQAAYVYDGGLVDIDAWNSDIRALYKPNVLEEQTAQKSEARKMELTAKAASHELNVFFFRCGIAVLAIIGVLMFLRR